MSVEIKFTETSFNNVCQINTCGINSQIILSQDVKLAPEMWSTFNVLLKGGFFNGKPVSVIYYAPFAEIIKLMEAMLKPITEINIINESVIKIPTINRLGIKPLEIIHDAKENPKIKMQDYYDTLKTIIIKKKTPYPNFDDRTEKSVTKQINWIRSVLGVHLAREDVELFIDEIRRTKIYE
jgi:hypothetical protein